MERKNLESKGPGTTPFRKKPVAPITMPFRAQALPPYVNDPDRTALLYCDIGPIVNKYSAADICLMCDVTGSMDQYKELVEDTLGKILDETKPLLHSPPRFAFLGFRDICDEEQLVTADFTPDVDKIRSSMKATKCDGGGDACEDLVTPMETAMELNWRSDLMVVILVIDCPTHGKSYHDEKILDDSLDYDKEKMLEKLCNHYRKAKVNLIVLKCGPMADMMIEIMRKFYDSADSKMTVIDIKMNEDDKKKAIYGVMMQKISGAVSNTILYNYRMIKSTPKTTRCDWRMAGMPLTLICNSYAGMFTREPNYEHMLYKYEIDIMPQLVEEKYTIASLPYGAGTFKKCYPLCDKEEKRRFVAKIPNKPVKEFNDLKPDIEGNIFVTAFTLDFNKFLGRSLIKALPLAIMEIKDGAEKQPMFNGSRFFVAQDFIEGDYTKYNNNYGWVNPDDKDEWCQLAQAFSHFTYEMSRGTAIVVDIQGAVQTTGKPCLVITDPAIHSAHYKGQFVEGNMGKIGILRFFETHKCNEFCKQLHLTDKATIATDRLSQIRAEHENEESLQHVYGGFEEGFKKAQEEIRSFDPSVAPTSEVLEVPVPASGKEQEEEKKSPVAKKKEPGPEAEVRPSSATLRTEASSSSGTVKIGEAKKEKPPV